MTTDTKKADRRIVKLHRAGLTLVEIAFKVGRTPDTVRRHLRLAGIEKQLGPLHDLEHVKRVFAKTGSFTQCARHFRVSRQAVFSRLKNAEDKP
jgi:predicted transcriptional regulator